MKPLLLVIGVAALAVGLLFVGQGTGVVAWPSTSFMISDIRWAYYGAAIAAFGLLAIAWSRR